MRARMFGPCAALPRTGILLPRKSSMAPRLVYLDTTIWNILSTQAPEACGVRALSDKLNVRLTLGLNAFFEMLKSFYGKRPDALARGRRLFACVGAYLQNGVSVLRTWEELLVDEAARASGRLTYINLFSDEEWHRKVEQGADLHSRGQLPRGLRELIQRRDSVSQTVRSSATESITAQPQMLEDLQGIGPQDIAAFLDSASVGTTGQNLLQKYLAQVFELLSQPMPLTGPQLAQTLLSFASNRVAHAVVRSDIYQNWRAARSKLSSTTESVLIAKCIPDDSYHVVNAAYCDVFVTEDRDGQAIAAQYVAPELKVLVYRDRNEPFLEWLVTRLGV